MVNAPSRIAIFGAGGHAKVVADIVRTTAEVACFVVRDPKECGPGVVLEDNLWASGVRHGVVAVGDNRTRRQIVERIRTRDAGFSFVAVVHPSVIRGSNVAIGDGTVVMPNVVLNADTVIGEHAIVNTSASVDHDCRVGDFASIAPGAVLGGGCRIGKSTAVALGARVIDGITIGEDTLVGAGSVVVRDLPAGVVAYGCPCKIVRSNRP